MTLINLSSIGLKPIKVVGSGSDGVVVKATNNVTHRYFAVKIVSIEDNLEDMFDNEASNVLCLNRHPNIVHTKSYHKISNYGVIVMEYISNDLMSYFLSKGRLSERKSKGIFYQMCKSVEFCHSKQIAHLDIKPENFLYDNTTKIVKLCDFHRSFHWENESERYQRLNDVTSMKYRAPEMNNRRSLNAIDKIDVWSLGVCLFGFLYAVFPFNLIDDKVDYDMSNFSNYITSDDYNVSLDAKDLILKMLTFDPEERPDMSTILSHPFFDSCL